MLDGTPVGTGTSFMFRDPDSDPGHELFLVSNKHVVKSGWNAYVFFTKEADDGTPILGEPFIVNMEGFEGQWHGHPDADVDVTVMPLSWQLDLNARSNVRAFVRPVTPETLATDEDLASLDVAGRSLYRLPQRDVR
ncbi:MAG: hypothetical protein NTW68_01895 [candidate division NC10 bacterium]|nr:hypothetical protein [candidate division NC10 bacterium]